MTNRGLFIAIEGGEGAGKSTIIPYLKNELERTLDVVTFREPGGTPFSEDVREVFFKYSDLSVSTAVHLMNAQRQENMDKIVNPALQDNKVVIVDRFIATTLVYQGILNNEYKTVEKLTHHYPMITVFVDVPPEVGLKRIADNKRETNHFDEMALEKHQVIYDGYRSLAERNPEQYWDIIIDGTKSIEEVQNDIHQLSRLLISVSKRGLSLPAIKRELRRVYKGMAHRPLKDQYIHYDTYKYAHLPIAILDLPREIQEPLENGQLLHMSDLMNASPMEIIAASHIDKDARQILDTALTERFSAVSSKQKDASAKWFYDANKPLIEHSVEKLDINNRAINRLAMARIYSIHELLQTAPADFLSIRQMGEKTSSHIVEQLLHWSEINNVPIMDYPLSDYIYTVTNR